MKQKLSFYTNIPTPYQLDFFNALSEIFDLHVVFYAKEESNRQWKLNIENLPYSVTMLKDASLVKPLLKFDHSYHFSWQIFKTILNDDAPFIIVGGTYHAPNVFFTLLLGKLKSKKIAFFSEKIPPENSFIRKIIKKIFLLPIKYWADYLITVGKEVAESYKFYGINLPHIVLPYNINNQLYNKESLSKNKLDELSQIFKPNNETILLSSGALIHRKGMDILIDAFLLLDPEIQKHIKLIIIGNGTEKENLLRRVDGNPNIILAGFKEKEEIPYYFAIADIFVFASRYDGWALVINEAFAAGLPVIASKETGAAREWIQHNINGYLVNEPSPKQYADYINNLVKNPELCKSMGKINLNIASENSSRQLSKDLSAFIAKVL
jgi:glycosyltransferase involved in cell wall biosynthesis